MARKPSRRAIGSQRGVPQGENLDGARLGNADLRGADLQEANLDGAKLGNANLSEAKLSRARLGNADLRGADLSQAVLIGANLDGADLSRANLDRAKLLMAKLNKADLSEAKLNKAGLVSADLRGATLNRAQLGNANLGSADLRNASLCDTNLSGADLTSARLDNAVFIRCNLEGVQAQYAVVDGLTLIRSCTVNKLTDFTDVGLDSARIASQIKVTLRDNIRRFYWRDWYKSHPFLQWPSKAFWTLSDYGSSTVRLICCFLVFAAIFAVIYLIPTTAPSWTPDVLTMDCEPLIANLEVVGDDSASHVSGWRLAFRAFYFSIVTMTTLGFGDMYANPNNWLGHVLLMVQVLIGYVLLGALITRLGILFNS